MENKDKKKFIRRKMYALKLKESETIMHDLGRGLNQLPREEIILTDARVARCFLYYVCMDTMAVKLKGRFFEML